MASIWGNGEILVGAIVVGAIVVDRMEVICYNGAVIW
jgi:hypothetical protein